MEGHSNLRRGIAVKVKVGLLWSLQELIRIMILYAQVKDLEMIGMIHPAETW